MRGRKPKPTYLKLLEAGTPADAARLAAAAAEEPQSDPIAEPPDHFTEEERKAWARTLKALPAGCITEADRGVFTCYVVAIVRHAKYKANCDKYGDVVKMPASGQPIPNPYYNMMNRQASDIRKYAAELGLSPVSRTRVRVPKDKRPGANPFANLQELPD